MTTLHVWFAHNGMIKEGILTSERAESSYGKPVLVVDGVAHTYHEIPVLLSWQHPSQDALEHAVCSEEQMRMRETWNRQADGETVPEQEIDVQSLLSKL